MRPVTLLLLLYDERAPGETTASLARLLDFSWAPVLEALAAAPQLRVAVRLSGTVIEFARDERPLLLRRLAELVARGQVEVVGGPHMNAPLHLIPRRDALAQLQVGNNWIRRQLGLRPKSAWLPQGAWDPGLARLLALAGFDTTFLDEGLVAAGTGSDEPVQGWYSTERQGSTLGILPLDRRLAAMIPWATPSQFLRELRQRRGNASPVFTVGVPVERLGYSPRAFRWCWEGSHPWVPTFFELLHQQRAWLKTALPQQARDRLPPTGRAYPVAGTPPTVGAAAMAPAAGMALTRMYHQSLHSDGGGYGAGGRLVTGPPWEVVLARYDEANQLHKRMLRASDAFHRLRRSSQETGDENMQPVVETARELLHQGQSLGPLHSGDDGLLYDGAVRHHAWRCLLMVEYLAASSLGDIEGTRREVADHDSDGRKELLVRTSQMAALVRPAGGGAISELHLWEVGNLANVLSRRAEFWHDEVARGITLPSIVDDVEQSEEPTESEDDWTLEITNPGYEFDDDTDSGTVALPTLPDLGLDLEDAESLVWGDRHRRGLFQDHLLGPGTTLENLRKGQHPQEGDFLDGDFRLISVEADGKDVVAVLSREGTHTRGEEVRLLRMAKRYRFKGGAAEVHVDYELRNRYHEPIRTHLGVELTLNLDSRYGPHRYIQLDVPGQDSPRTVTLEQSVDVPKVSRARLSFVDKAFAVELDAMVPGRLVCYPVESIHRGRTMYHRAFQGTCFVWIWPLALWGQEKVDLGLSLKVIRL